ncbi:hypothetical protein J6S88_01025 [bacterium]|nr:hypothetical protein [bacterium]
MEFVLNGVKWGVQFVRGTDNRLRRSDGVLTLGVTDAIDGKIYLSESLTGSLLEHVLCHELTHAVCFSYNIYIPIETEEWLCNYMADHGKEIIYLLDKLLQSMERRRFA